MESKSMITQLANLLQSCISKKAYLQGKLLHGYTLRNGLSADTFLSNRLVEFYCKCGYTSTAGKLFDRMPHRNIYSWHAMLDGHCKANMLKDAHELFAAMPERNTVSWNMLITALVRSGFEEKALGVFCRMNLEGFVPTHFTLASVLSACALKNNGFGRECHCLGIKVGLEKNIFVANALLCMYAKCQRVDDAILVFKNLGDPNEVSFTTMMKLLAETNRIEEAFSMFKTMHRTGAMLDCVAVSSILGVCARARTGESCVEGFPYYICGQEIHGLAVKLGFQNDLHLSNSLLDMYAKAGDIGSSEIIFYSLPKLSVTSWNIMIGGYGQKNLADKAVGCLHRMQVHGYEPDEVTYINMLSTCVKSERIETARLIFDQMVCPSLTSWNAMLSSYSQNGNHKEAVKLFREMQFRNVQLDQTTMAIILSSCAALMLLQGGKQVHGALLRANLHTDIFIISGLIGMYSKCNKPDMATYVFDRMSETDVVCWNSMIAGLSENCLHEEAFTLFKKMLEKGLFPSQFSYATVLSCCAKLFSLSHGRQVHALISKDGFKNDIFVGSSLINMYSKCGDVDLARQFFDEMPYRSTVTWNEMIHGYAQNGRGEEAVAVYENMIDLGVRPDDITLVAVFTACSHAGMVDIGITIFNSMKLEHGIEPQLGHYTCMIDALGRAGRFHEAEVMLDKMPMLYRDDPIIWEVLLSCCRVHANVSLARKAAEELIRLDPQNSAPYVLLANIYTSLGRWEEVRAIREVMGERQVLKNPGFSWVENKSRRQGFNVFGMTVDEYEGDVRGDG